MFAQKFIAWRKQIAQLTRGEIAFYDAPEPVLALRRDLPGQPSVLVAFNLGAQPLAFDWQQARNAKPLTGHGLPGSAQDATITLPAFGAWFGLMA